MATDNLLNQINKSCLRHDLPNLAVGEKVEVIIKTKTLDKDSKQEKDKLTSFQGIIISWKRPRQISCNFTVLKESSKIIVKQIFFYNSPLIVEIKKLGQINRQVRRAKLYFLEREMAKKKEHE